MEKCGNYVFLALKDAMACINMKVNLLAAVMEIGVPIQSGGFDQSLSLKVIDSSIEHAVSVVFSSEGKSKLPDVKSPGDIIILKRVVMRARNKEVYAFFNNKFSAFALFAGQSCEKLNPYQFCSEVGTTDVLKEHVELFRTSLISCPGMSGHLFFLREIKPRQYFDLLCKVLHMRKVSDAGWILYVWDGTDCPPINFAIGHDTQAESLHPLQVEQVPLSRSILCTFPPLGTVLRIFVSKCLQDLTGNWVKLHNIICQIQSGFWRGVWTSCSQVFILSHKDEIVKSRKRYYRERLSSNLNRLPLTSFPWPSRITDTDHEHARFSTLMDIVIHKEVTFKYKCVVRVVAVYPPEVENFRSAVTRKYRIRFTLEDPTARIHAGLVDGDGEKFFGGYSDVKVLVDKMNKVLGVSGKQDVTSRNPPWVQMCILSFYQDEKDKWGSRKYRIFDTTLVG